MSPEAALFGLLGLALTVVATAYIAAPLLRGVVVEAQPDERAVGLLLRREAILANLRDLDADHADGRLGEADHAELRSEALAEGAAVLAALDELTASTDSRSALYVAQVEADVAARVGSTAAIPSTEYCTKCGRALGVADAYCASCGTRVGAEVEG